MKKALGILNVMLSESGDEPLSVADIARKAGIDKSACHRILITMMDDGVISQSKSGSYKIGVGLLRIGQMSLTKVPMVSIANDLLGRLTERTGESSYLFVENRGERICIAKADSPQLIRHYVRFGASLPLYAGASGKVFLAAFSDEQLRDYLKGHKLEPIGPNAVTDPVRLKEELQVIRQRGVAWSYMERSSDAASVGAPVRNENGAVVGSISVAGPIQRMKSISDSDWEAMVKETSLELSTVLNYRPGKTAERWTLEHME